MASVSVTEGGPFFKNARILDVNLTFCAGFGGFASSALEFIG